MPCAALALAFAFAINGEVYEMDNIVWTRVLEGVTGTVNKEEYDLNDEKKEEIGIIFGKILENCGVFKNTPKGNDGIVKFVNSVK